MKNLCRSMLLVLLCCWASGARADEPTSGASAELVGQPEGGTDDAQDPLAAYALSESAWNGLSSFATLLDHLGVRAREASAIDLGTEDVDVLMIVHPTSDLNTPAIAAWVRGGGGLWVLDDFGSAEALLREFELARVTPGRHAESLSANPALPMLAQVGTHELSRDVHRLVLNHPSALRGPGLPVFAFADGAGAVYDMSLGAGTAVFVSDPSVLTNLMLPIRGNARFAANVLERLCPAECDLVLLSGEVHVEGPLRGASTARSEQGGTEIAQAIRDALERLRDPDVHPGALRAASVLLLFGTIFFAGNLFPLRSARFLGQRIGVRSAAPVNEFEFNLRRFLGRQKKPSFALPAALLKERFEALFYPALGMSAPAPDATAAYFARAAARYAARFEPGASARRTRSIQATLSGLGRISNPKMTSAGRAPWLESKDLLRWHQETTEILQTMELNERFLSDVQRPT